MKYFKLVDENGSWTRLDASETNVSNGIEITEEEYNSLSPKPIDADIDVNSLFDIE